MTLKAIDFRTCAVHGENRIHHMGHCARCKEEGIPPPKQPPLKEPVTNWLRRVIVTFDCYADARKVKESSRQSSGLRGRGKPLTEFERSVFTRLGYSVPIAQIAEELGVEAKAVCNTIYRLQNKYLVCNREQLRAIARKTASGHKNPTPHCPNPTYRIEA